MNDSALVDVLNSIKELENRFEEPTTAAAPHLNTVDRATFKRLMLEAKSILDGELGRGNAFGVPLLQMTNLPGYGAFNPPSLGQVHEASALVEGGLNQLRLKQRQPQAQRSSAPRPFYVDLERIEQLRKIRSPLWDLKRLVRLLQELNIAHAGEAHMATAMLVRAVLDHVAPIFGKATFNEVANNYAAPRSFKEQMKHLDESLRKIADSHLHLPVRQSEVLPLGTQVDFRAAVDVLLAEIVRLAT